MGGEVFHQYWQKATHVFHSTFELETSAMASHGLHLLEAIKQQLEQAEISSYDDSSDLANLLSNSNVFLASQVRRSPCGLNFQCKRMLSLLTGV